MTDHDFDQQLTGRVLLPIMFETLHREYGVAPRTQAEQQKIAQMGMVLLAEHDEKQARVEDRFSSLLNKAANKMKLPADQPTAPSGEELAKAAATVAADKDVQPFLDAFIRAI